MNIPNIDLLYQTPTDPVINHNRGSSHVLRKTIQLIGCHYYGLAAVVLILNTTWDLIGPSIHPGVQSGTRLL